MKFFYLVLSLFFSLAGPLYAEEAVPSAPAQPTFPGVAEIIPRAAQLTEKALSAETQLKTLKDLSLLQNDINSTKSRQEDLLKRVSGFGAPHEWNFDRLLEVRNDLNGQMTGLKKLLDTLSQRLSLSDQIRQRWREQEDFWKEWQKFLRTSKEKIPSETFTESLKTSRRIIDQAVATNEPLVAAQKDIIGLQTALLDVQNQIDSALNLLRKQTFKKTTHSFFNQEFYQQFNEDLLQSAKNGISDAQQLKWDFLSERPWLPVLQIFVALALALFIRRQSRGAQITQEWHFIVRHPWATGIFAAVVSFSALYVNAPSFWRLGLSVLAAASSAILVSGLLKNPRKRFMVYLLAVLFILTQVLQLINFPAPLYRLYLALLCLLGLPLLLMLAKRNLNAHEGRMDGFTLSLRGGAAILLLALVTQISGYSNLSSRLINSSVSTVFLSLFLAMTIRLAHGGIRFLLTHPVVIRRPFFYRYGDDLITRLSKIFQFFIGAYSLLYLFVVWGIYDSVGQTWRTLRDLSMTLGEVEISLHMVVLVALTLYFAISFSWFLRAVLEAQVFPHRDMDRGIRDAIKKLLHYAIVFVGFLFAMSLAGVELKNFAVLAGAFGIGIGFGLQNIVNNFVSGIILLFERPVRVGDVIMIDGEWSTVRKIGLRSTMVETPNRSEIIVPNSDLISQKVTNWTLSSNTIRIVIPVGVAYGSDVAKTLAVLHEVATTCDDVLDSPEPSPIFAGFGDSSLDFQLRFWIAEADQILHVRSTILQRIDQRFREEGLEIPFPQRDVHLKLEDTQILRREVPLSGPPSAPQTPENA